MAEDSKGAAPNTGSSTSGPLERAATVLSRIAPANVSGWVGYAVVLAAVLAGARLFFRVVHGEHAGAVRTISWATLLLGAYVGWGTIVERVAFRERRADWGLRAGWGLAALIAIGGVLIAVDGARPVTTLALVGIGLGALAIDGFALCRAPPRAKVLLRVARRDMGFRIVAAIALAMAAVQTVGATGDVSRWHWGDDAPGYSVIVAEIAQRGSSIQPFSFHRLSAYGGAAYLQAMLAVFAPENQWHVLDRGLCLLVVVGLTLGAARERSGVMRLLASLPALVAVTLPNIRDNYGAEMSGVAMFLALWRTLDHPTPRAPRFSSAIVASLVAAAACTIRQNLILAAVATMVASYVLILARGGFARPLRDRRDEAIECAVAAGAMIGALLPWAITSYRSSNSPMWPLIKGNYQAVHNGYFASIGAVARVKALWDAAAIVAPVSSLPIFLFAGLALRDSSKRRATRALFVGGFIGFVGLVWTWTRSFAHDLARYYFPFEIATILAITLAALPRQGERLSSRRAWAAGLAILACLLQIAWRHEPVSQDYLKDLDTMAAFVTAAKNPEATPNNAADERYARLQSAMASGERALVMLDEPFRLDFTRNRIYTIDQPSFVAPPPGLPLHDPEQLAQYLLDHGIRYFAFVRPTASAENYSRASWEHHLRDKGLPIHSEMAPLYLAVFDEAERLPTVRRVIATVDEMVLVDVSATP
ncbi:MAG TPA: hypothetical protein VLM85_27725 [Polyangiaceae bacterium]|nr:hypothetical protein [Polyangiaceae bacterium]